MSQCPTTARAVTFRLLTCTGIAGCAFLAGTWLRTWMAGPPDAGAKGSGLVRFEGPASSRGRETDTGSLRELDFANAAQSLRALKNSTSPQHDLLAACEKLLAEARTNADFQRLVLLVNEAPFPKFIEPLIVAAFLRWTEIDPEAAAVGVDTVRYMHMRLRIVNDIFTKWTQRDPEAALAFLQSVPPGSVRRDGPGAAFRTLAEADPESAARRALEWKMEVYPLSVMKAVFGAWVAKDAAAALDFAGKAYGSDRRHEMLSALMEVLPPERAWREALLQGDPNSSGAQSLLSHALDRWGHQIEAPVAAVLALPPGPTRDRMMQQAAEHAARNGLARGEALLETMPDEATRLQWLTALARGTLQDPGHPRPAEAIRLAVQLPSGETRQKLIAEAGERWGKLDPAAASEWLRQQPAGPLRDAFAAEFVRGTFALDPAAALTWAAAIKDDALRTPRLEELYSRWKQRDLPAATAWLEQAQVNDRDRAELRRQNER
jgi:hypothetical protein